MPYAHATSNYKLLRLFSDDCSAEHVPKYKQRKVSVHCFCDIRGIPSVSLSEELIETEVNMGFQNVQECPTFKLANLDCDDTSRNNNLCTHSMAMMQRQTDTLMTDTHQ